MFRKKDKREEVQKQSCDECVFKQRYNELDEDMKKVIENNGYLCERANYLTEIMNDYEKQNRALVKLLNEKCAKIRELSNEKD